MIYVETDRLILRDWLPDDTPLFIALNQDPEVMQFLLPASEKRVVEMIEGFKAHISHHGYGLFACEIKDSSKFIGFVGLNTPNFTAHFSPCIEIGWRLDRSAWNQGYATEAAKAILEVGFNRHHLEEIVAFTVRENYRSRKVMEKIGMIHDLEGDFIHPKVPENSPLQWHVLYRISKKEY
jgi:RimJ/RimL family protein N-acetyltransferase